MCQSNSIFGCDLFNTLITGPDADDIFYFLEQLNITRELSAIQIELFCSGFPFASYIKTYKEAESLREEMLVSERKYPPNPSSRFSEVIARQYVTYYIDNCKIDSDLATVLQKLKNQAIPTCVISNIYAVYAPVIEKLNLALLIDKFYLSYAEHKRKPAKEIFKRAFPKGAESFFIGDNYKSDIKPLLDTNIHPIFLSSSNKVLVYIQRNGLNDFIVSDLGSEITINAALYKLLRRYGIIRNLGNNTVSKRELIVKGDKIYLHDLQKVYLVNGYYSVPQIIDKNREYIV